ncbi:pentapeptide repeat-containing protein [Aquimarina agarivorans]|uniref:pentapeptide repeat-containing protein n=1 Tax=Aquimarina agarivorans TaxID=980584 RepID=UPI000248EF9D|nr:pentapeptide repeat-containing protein [Aquimarina agarivorans]
MINETTAYENKAFKNVDYSEENLSNKEYYNCQFIGCNFSKSDLRGSSYEDCTFQDCNISQTEIEGVGFRNSVFIASKILGIDFARCNNLMFTFKFDNCKMDYCTFFGTNLKKTHFIKCSQKDVDFSEADLSSSFFTNSDLTRARFSNTILEKADFRGAINFTIDPESNKMKKAKFSSFQLEGLLFKYLLDIV